jgi:hypothetical protein
MHAKENYWYIFVSTQQLTPTLHFRVIHKRNYTVSMGMSFFTMPTQRQAGRPLQTVAHGQRP